MKKCFIILEDGFEECEALICHDIFHRSGQIETVLAGAKHLEVVSSIGLKVKADALLKDLNLEEFDFCILPGGKLGVDNINASDFDKEVIRKMFVLGKHVHAICAAPSVLGNMGYLDNKRFTCFPGFERGKGTWVDTGCVIDGTLVTGRSMGHSIEFAEAIVKLELGEQYLTKIHHGTLGI